MNIIQSQSMSTPPSTPASPDKKVRFVVANSDSEPINQAGQSRVVLPDNSEGLYRKFTRFPITALIFVKILKIICSFNPQVQVQSFKLALIVNGLPA